MARILLVDDDPSVRTVVTLMLQRAGHQVDVRSTGPEAIRSAGADLPDLVLSDLCMPGMEGDEVLRAIKKICPSAICVLMTGDADQSATCLDPDTQFLRKPFSMATLIEKVDSAMGAAK